MNEKKQIGMASILSYLAMILQILISILTTPYIVSKIGDAAYGVYKIIASFVAYMTVLNFGLGTAAQRYLAEYRINNDKYRERKLLEVVHLLNYVISILILLFGVGIYKAIPLFFTYSMSEREISLAQNLFVILLMNMILSVFTDKYVGIINAYEQFSFVKLLEVIRCLAKIVLIYSILFFSDSAVVLALIDLFLNFIILAGDMFFCRRKLNIRSRFRVDIQTINWKDYREFLLYAGGIFVSMIINQLLWNVDSVVIGMRLGAVESAIYAVGTTFSSAFFNASIIITNMLLPKVVRMTETGASNKEYTDFVIKTARIQAYVILYLYVAFAIYGREFIELWMGDGYLGAWLTALLVMTGTLFSSFVISVQVIIRAQKRQRFYNLVHLFIFSMNAVLTYYAVEKWGISGAALMTMLTYFVGYVFIMYPYYRIKIHISIVSVFTNLFCWCIPTALFIGCVGWMFKKSIALSWTNLTIQIVLYTMIYMIFMFLVMNQNEKKIITDILNRAKGRGLNR